MVTFADVLSRKVPRLRLVKLQGFQRNLSLPDTEAGIEEVEESCLCKLFGQSIRFWFGTVVVDFKGFRDHDGLRLLSCLE
jgi:hypothetical protein